MTIRFVDGNSSPCYSRWVEIRRLNDDDLDNLFACRLRALKSTPSAFLVSLEEEKAKGPSHFSRSLGHKGTERAIFGAFDDQ